MPRGEKIQKNYSTQIAALNDKSAKHKSNIAILKAKRQELINKQEQQNMKDLQEYMSKNNLAPDDVISKLKAAK